MMLRLLLASALLFAALPGSAFAQHVYAVPNKGGRQHEEIRARGLDILGLDSQRRMLVYAPAKEEAFLSSWGAPAKMVLEEGSSVSAQDPARKDLSGIYAAYHTYAETQSALQFLASTYPTLCELQSMGTSWEGRDIPVMRITNLATATGDRPEVLIFGNLHARELMSVEIPLLFAQHLLVNYGTDPQVTALVDGRDIYIAPMMNPDGHVYVENNNGGDWSGWWRKNRRDLGGGTYGVDLNRNFSYQWGYDDVGSSGAPWSITYRGPSPFSEPETQALRDFCAAHEFTIALSYHSFSELLLYPWGYVYDYTVDHELFRTVAVQLTADSGYFPGNPAEGAIYITNGGSDDWGYGDAVQKNSFLAFTVEVNSFEQGGFGPPDTYIGPTFDLLLSMNLGALELADEPRKVLGPIAPVLNPNASFAAPSLTLDWSENVVDDPNPAVGYTVEEFKNLGPVVDAADADTGIYTLQGFTVSSTAYAGSGSYYSGQGDNLSNYIETVAPYVVDTNTQTFSCRLRYDIESDWDYAYVMVSTDGLVWEPVPGTVTTNTDPNDVNLGHGITGSTGGAWVLADFDLSAYLGQTVALRLQYVTDGSVQGAGIWADELASTPAFESRRFVVQDHPTNSVSFSLSEVATYGYRVKAVDADGDESRWSNLTLLALDPVTAVGEVLPRITHLAGNYPNPFNPRTLVSFEVGEAGRLRLDVYDLAGRRVRTLEDARYEPGAYRVVFDGQDDEGRELPSGVYLVRMSLDGEAFGSRKMTLLR